MIFLAVDIGGTFTDLIAYDQSKQGFLQAKSLTTPHDPVEGILDCMRKAELAVEDVGHFIHGSTTAINTLIERKGAKVGLIVTRGTRDVYLIGRGNRPDAYNIFFNRPTPLLSRAAIHEVNERLYASGAVREAIDLEQLRGICSTLAEQGVEAVAICFLHAYANPAHERAAGKIVQEMLPKVYVSLSHEILREYREYERISTTVVNSYIGPKVGGYVRNLQTRLAAMNFKGELAIMQSNGGVMAATTAVQRPVMMMESGPVGGIIAGAEVGKALGFKDVVSFDMGGTTAKASLVRDGEPSMAEGYYVGGYASGHPVMMPVVDVVEVGAGGGSIAWIDEVGALKVGPRSAGADPGPICYKLGGTQPTITDANVILGRIGAEDFLGGEMRLDRAAATAGMKSAVADPLTMGTIAAARAVIEIAIAKMSLAVREVSVAKGYDPRDFAMVASGGAGPPHAVTVARELNIPTVIIPRFPSHFSALGMVMTDERHDFVRTFFSELGAADFDALRKIMREMRAEARRLVSSDKEMTAQILFDLRYVGQEFALQIPITDAQLDAGDVKGIRAAYDAMHEHRYAHSSGDERIEVINVRLIALGKRTKLALPAISAAIDAPKYSTRAVVFNDDTPVETRVFAREDLRKGQKIDGPALVVEYGTTTVIFPGDHLKVADTGELVISVRSA